VAVPGGSGRVSAALRRHPDVETGPSRRRRRSRRRGSSFRLNGSERELGPWGAGPAERARAYPEPVAMTTPSIC